MNNQNGFLALCLISVLGILAMVSGPTGMAVNCASHSSDIVVCRNSAVSGPLYIGEDLVDQDWKQRGFTLDVSEPIYDNDPYIVSAKPRLFDGDDYVARRQLTVRNRDGTYRNV